MIASNGIARRIRVLHVIDSLALGGAQVVLENLIKHGDCARFEFEVAAMHGRGQMWDRLAALGVPMRSLSFHHKVPLYMPRLVWRCLLRRYDVVHTHLLAANVIAKPLAALCGVRVRINHDHCNDKLVDPRKWALRADTITNRLSTHVVAVSESTREFLIQHEAMEPSRVTTIHNGIDLDLYRPRKEMREAAREKYGLPADAFIIAGVGRLTHQKNFGFFLNIAKEIAQADPRAMFVLAGTGEEEDALRAQAAHLGIAARVRFLGFVADMPTLWPALDCLLLTSHYEGLPITILEAMACGVPIVASNLDGMREILHDGENAALLPPGESAPYVAAVRALMESPALGARRADAALATVRAGYSATGMTHAVEAIYLRYLEGRR